MNAFEQAVEQRLDFDPARIALEKRLPDAAAVATRVKYLQRARAKLPSWFAARCELPPRAYEQASSETAALCKWCEGDAALDLTCGLGVDAWALSKRFRRVVALERDEALASTARENFRRLGVSNIEVLNIPAETYLADRTEHFDWIWADPDRRDATGRRRVRLEDCSPNVLTLPLHGKLALKLSPLFDVKEARRLFPDAHIEVLSLHDECKEVRIWNDGGGPRLSAHAPDKGLYMGTGTTYGNPEFAPDYLFIPDVALQKAGLAREYMAAHGIWSESETGFGFSENPVGKLGRWERIRSIERYDPRKLHKDHPKGATVLLRDFPLRHSLKPGPNRIALTTLHGEYTVIEL